MPGSKPSIFRAEALRCYVERTEKPVFPRLVSPRMFFFMWILLALVLGGGLLAWLARMPVYSPAIAVVVDGPGTRQWASDEPLIALFLSSEELPRLRVGQRVFLKLEQNSETISRQIIAVDSHIFSLKSAEDYFALSAGAASRIAGAKAVALTRLERVPAGMASPDYVGGFYDAWVEVGSRRVISLFRF